MCFTPYQLITAMYYSYVFPNVNKTLIYMDYSDYKIEQRFYLKYFDSVVYVPSYINDNILIKQFKKCYYGGHLYKFTNIHNYLKNKNKTICFIFSDQECLSYKALVDLYKKKDNVIILTEEGLGTYVKNSKLPLKTMLINKILGINTLKYVGESNKYDYVFVKKPNKLEVDKFLDKKVILENEFFNDFNFINDLNINLDSILLNNKFILFLGSPIDQLKINKDEYVRIIKEIILKFNNQYRIVIKPHHMEDISIYNGLKDIILIDKYSWVPAELIVQKYNPIALFGIYSASIMNIAQLKPNLSIYLLYGILGLNLPDIVCKSYLSYKSVILINDYIDFYNINLYNDTNNVLDINNKNLGYEDGQDVSILSNLLYTLQNN